MHAESRSAAPQPLRFTALSDDVRVAHSSDYDTIAAVLDQWWGRPMLDALPRLFLDHFHTSSLFVPGTDAAPLAFLIGFGSPSVPQVAYIHFVGVNPSARGQGWGRRLYETFFTAASQAGYTRVECVTSPVNTSSIAFHRAMGFRVGAVRPDHGGPGHALIDFSRELH